MIQNENENESTVTITPDTLKHLISSTKGAIFTIANEESGNRFTFKIQRKSDDDPFCFVGLLTGTDNTRDYTYIGCLTSARHEFVPKKTDGYDTPPGVKAFQWFWHILTHTRNFPADFRLYHSGRCFRCGRLLTTPLSCKYGLGPICMEKI